MRAEYSDWSGLMINLKVKLSDRSYPIHIGNGAFEAALAEFEKARAASKKLFCVADAAVAAKHKTKLAALSKTAEIFEINGGESSKSLANVEKLCSILAEKNIDRKSCLIALGGGVIGDLTGFVASVYMRGIDFYQLPTTLLAMVDSSVGGKTGVNIPEGKNLVGSFHQPRAVFADTRFLNTLPRREFAAGMAEVIKCAVLGDRALFSMLERESLSCKHSKLPEAIRRCCRLKAEIVSADERETSKSGGRALLNFGHTFGHAIEKCAGYGNYLHGEAVGIGMLMASRLADKLAGAESGNFDRIKSVLRKCGLPVKLSKLEAADMLEAMYRDKKTLAGKLKFVLADKIGESRTEHVDSSDVLSVLEDFLR